MTFSLMIDLCTSTTFLLPVDVCSNLSNTSHFFSENLSSFILVTPHPQITKYLVINPMGFSESDDALFLYTCSTI